jgi:hypothetical protein
MQMIPIKITITIFGRYENFPSANFPGESFPMKVSQSENFPKVKISQVLYKE